MQRATLLAAARWTALFLLLPAAAYLAAFAALTWPIARYFSTHYFTDSGDGLVNVWNLWWVNKAVTELGRHPWYTEWLHYPHGITLLGHTLNMHGALVALPLLRFLTLTQAHNVLVVSAFVLAGVTAFWLAREAAGGGYAAPLLGGGVYTFSAYHWAHQQGHLQLVSLQWLPLFLLCWLRLLRGPTRGRALGAAGALLLVILCDYYYFLYCCLAAVVLAAWHLLAHREGGDPLGEYWWRSWQRYRGPLALFVAGVAGSSGLLAGTLLREIVTEGYAQVGHPPGLFSMDLLAPVIPGGHWRFAALTEWYWGRLPGVIHESSVHLGLGVLGAAGWVWWRRHRLQVPDLGQWYVLALVFGVLALGPHLQLLGRVVRYYALPYAGMERVLPVLATGGVPVRFVVMVTLCAAVVVAVAARGLAASERGRRWLPAWLALLVVEHLPGPRPLTRLEPPPYVEVLRQLPGEGAVLDTVAGLSRGLYWQTIHGRPQPLGYVARLPRGVNRRANAVRRLLEAGQYGELRSRFRVRYLVLPPGTGVEQQPTVLAGAQVVYAGPEAQVLDLGPAP